MHRALVFLALCASVAADGIAHAGTPLPDGPHVVVSGEGKVTAVPDVARITLSAVHRDSDPAVAKRRVDQSVEALLALLPEFGVRPEAITAASLDLSDDSDYDEPSRKPIQSRASRRIELRFDQLDRLGAFLDAAIAAGVQEVQGITFESSRKEALLLEARTKAVADAREEAAGLAGAFGTRLGQVYSINSVNSGFASGYGATLDRIELTGSRVGGRQASRYLQPEVHYTERVAVVFELAR